MLLQIFHARPTQPKVLNIPHNKLDCYSTLSPYGLWSRLPPLTAWYPGSAKGHQSLVQQCEPIPGKTSVWVQIKPVIQFPQWTSLLALLLKPVHTCLFKYLTFTAGTFFPIIPWADRPTETWLSPEITPSESCWCVLIGLKSFNIEFFWTETAKPQYNFCAAHNNGLLCYPPVGVGNIASGLHTYSVSFNFV